MADTKIKKEPEITPELVASHGLSIEEYGRVLKILGRTPTYTELGIFSVMWSEHCSYKSSRKHLGRFPTKAPWVIQGPGENAGVIDIGDGLRGGIQDGVAQPPLFHRAVSGRGDGRGRDTERRIHDGREAHREHGLAPLRAAGRAEEPVSAWTASSRA